MRQIRLYEQVEKTLAEEISNGVYKPGDPLPPERDLMERFSVGRPSVREALFSLSRRGLVEVGSGRRPRVTSPSFEVVVSELNLIVRQVLRDSDNIIHLIKVRGLLEGALARKAAQVATETQLAELKEKLEANRLAIGTYEPFWKTDSEFHSYIAKICDNPLIPIILDTILDWLIEQRRVTVWEPGAGQISYDHHEKIVQAIEARDPDRAEAAMQTHLDYIESNVRKIQSGSESAGPLHR